ncbi:lipoprotein-releasing system permease protein [Pseudarcicella hirudinis]|uniref:Lipoprotein-releasing system permease protein n=1 Tax=Pseudarcicella hirudinis TaxID=1079859 RepID=A0A1I5XZK7_9BACT|nr:FtsX-like permease family protein [Pseudarcicella hirudinis]SFQ37431.1 lipoprotein-releasing system permease protein [Pseudarcicella hirudinis]
MNFPLYIARRYFFAKKKASFISLISNISMLGVGVGVTALVIVLSVFNGLEDFQRGLYKSFDPNLKISPKEGKNFLVSEALLKKLQQTEGVASVTQVIQENALLRYRDAQMVVNLKGVDDNFIRQNRLKNSILQGNLVLHEKGQDYMVMGTGVYLTLGVNLEDFLTPVEVWFPKNTGSKTIDFTSADAFSRLNILPSGIFAIEQEYDDNYVFVPLSFAKELFEYGNKRTALEVQIKSGADLARIQSSFSNLLGDQFIVQNQDEQHATLLRAIKIEKLFVFLTLSFIIGIASFNIFFSLSMLAIEKKEDVKTLYAMGATSDIIMKIFLFEGAIVAFSGAIFGLILGFLACWLQETFGFISMGIANALVDAYPVKMQFSDFLYTSLTVSLLTVLASYFPARRATEAGIIS